MHAPLLGRLMKPAAQPDDTSTLLSGLTIRPDDANQSSATPDASASGHSIHLRVHGAAAQFCTYSGGDSSGSSSTDAEPPLAPPRLARTSPCLCTVERDAGGMTNVGFRMKLLQPMHKFATVIAGNSGRPGGACGLADGTVTSLHAQHKTRIIEEHRQQMPRRAQARVRARAAPR